MSGAKMPHGVCNCDQRLPKPDAPAWKVGDRAVWLSGSHARPKRPCTVKAVGPDFCVIQKDGGDPPKCVFTHDLIRPAPKRQKVVVLEYKHPSGGVRWDTDDGATGQYGWRPTGRTHEFEVEEDE